MWYQTPAFNRVTVGMKSEIVKKNHMCNRNNSKIHKGSVWAMGCGQQGVRQGLITRVYPSQPEEGQTGGQPGANPAPSIGNLPMDGSGMLAPGFGSHEAKQGQIWTRNGGRPKPTGSVMAWWSLWPGRGCYPAALLEKWLMAPGDQNGVRGQWQYVGSPRFEQDFWDHECTYNPG